MPEWRETLRLYVQQYIQEWENGGKRYLLTQYWVTLKSFSSPGVILCG